MAAEFSALVTHGRGATFFPTVPRQPARKPNTSTARILPPLQYDPAARGVQSQQKSTWRQNMLGIRYHATAMGTSASTRTS